MRHALVLILSLAASWLAGASQSLTVTVSPGDLGVQFSYDGLVDGDTVTVTVVPASGWTIVSSRVSDPLLLGWLKTGDHVFRLSVIRPPTDRDWQMARFLGMLRPVGGGGSGTGPPPSDHPFSFDGRIKRIGTDEGTSSDLSRQPPAQLTSQAPPPPVQQQGQASYNLTQTADGETWEFIGTFAGFTGQHEGVPGADARTPVEIETVRGPSLGGGGVEVWISYHGAEDGIGGIAQDERILVNQFQSADGAAMNRWVAWLAETMKHEDGHSRILHRFVDILTQRLSVLRSIGWSPQEPRARQLSRSYWQVCRALLVRQVINEHGALQRAYDATTNHGADQESWSWENLP